MLLTSVIIILREVLEAAILTSILLASCKILSISIRWFFLSLPIGFCGAWLYAQNMFWISELYDYSGQERVNGAIQIAVFVAALLSSSLLSGACKSFKHYLSLLQLSLAAMITLVIVREGSEIIIYLQSFTYDPTKLLSVIAGGAIGFCIGASVGILFFWGLAYRDSTRSLLICQSILAVVVSGMLSQVVILFEQADLLPATAALWDSSALIAEDSIVGQLLYAVFSYEATPSKWQLFVYCAGLISFFLVQYMLHSSEGTQNED